MDSILLQEAVEAAGRQSRLHNLLVARHGEVVVERHFRGPAPDRPANVKSVSKSLLSAVVGGAIQEGYLEGVDIPMAPFFPEFVPTAVGDGGTNGSDGTSRGEGADGDGAEGAGDEGAGDQGAGRDDHGGPDPRGAITVGHLLSMSSGLQSTSFGNYGRWVASSNWTRWVLERPMIHEPGDRMVYSTGNSHLVSALLVRASGMSTHALAQRTLAEPAGIRLPPWPTDPQGIHFGGNDMLISPRDLLRFGELYRHGGALNGEQILDREWIEESWRPRVRSRRDGNGYGLGWWARTAGGHEVRFAWGYGGQFLFIIPELELTVVFTSDPWSAREGGHNQVLHRIVDDLLVPAAVAGAAPSTPNPPTPEST
ncbi:MAG: class C beta-lactamase-related serine hydrolase [Gemmatimonadales bacterium]|nr:MAG: class C beta-lactamase-related serine hydrolase [Gemmatimonadales bacterium]